MKLHSWSDQYAIAQEASPYPVIARSAARAEAVRRDVAIQSVAGDSGRSGQPI